MPLFQIIQSRSGVCVVRVYSCNLEQVAHLDSGVDGDMRLESEARKESFLEQRYTHGKWRITKIYIKGELREIIVNHREDYPL